MFSNCVPQSPISLPSKNRRRFGEADQLGAVSVGGGPGGATDQEHDGGESSEDRDAGGECEPSRAAPARRLDRERRRSRLLVVEIGEQVGFHRSRSTRSSSPV
jgi:hypothetical protein